MPCLEISIPKLNDDVKINLAKQLTETFGKISGFPSEIFGIRFYEYNLSDAFSGGEMTDKGQQRPYLHFLLYIPRISRDVKKGLVKEFTRVFTEVTGYPEWKPVIHIAEHPYDNVGVEGQLLSDAYPDLAGRKFYYDLPKK
ncbi:MAG: tautomerase family protein [Candidatus Zixiibacteriota bacterium]